MFVTQGVFFGDDVVLEFKELPQAASVEYKTDLAIKLLLNWKSQDSN